ncbi:MAG: FG-GAP-like repeat-containing protein, partial [Pirellulaceae bacterium]
APPPPPIPAGPTLSINDVTILEGNPGRKDATFTVTLSAAATQPVTVNYAMQDGTAKNPSDYTGLSGFGGFAAPVQIGDRQNPAGYPPASVEVADVNLDSIADILTYRGASPTLAGLILGVPPPGQPSTASATQFSIASFASGTATNPIFETSDFNRDGLSDLVVRTGKDIFVTPGQTGGWFGAPIQFGTPGKSTGGFAVGDFNNDSFVDFVAGSTLLVGSADRAQGLSIFLNQGGLSPLSSSSFATSQPIDLGSDIGEISTVVAIDMTGDGKQDLVFMANSAVGRGSTTARLYVSNGDGTFQPAIDLGAFPGGLSPQVADINHDGLDDLMTLDQENGLVVVRLRDPNLPRFLAPITYKPEGTPIALELSDLNQDGNVDAVALNQDSKSVSLFYGTSTGTFLNPQNFSTGSLQDLNFTPNDLAIGDVNGDGISDAIVGNSNGPNGRGDAVAVSVCTNSTAGSLTFAPGETTKEIHVSIIGDKNIESDEAFSVLLSAAVNATISDGTGTGTIVNDDAPGDDYVEGGDGNDTLFGGGAPDIINGQGGNDLVFGGDGDDSLLGGAGNDTLDGQIGNDTLNGQAGDDLLLGGDNDDTFRLDATGSGGDSANGGEGLNTILVNGTNLADAFTVSSIGSVLTVGIGEGTIAAKSLIQNVLIDARGGNDTVTFASVAGVPFSVLTVQGGDGNDVIIATQAGSGAIRLKLNGDVGNDTITGSSGIDTIDG